MTESVVGQIRKKGYNFMKLKSKKKKKRKDLPLTTKICRLGLTVIYTIVEKHV